MDRLNSMKNSKFLKNQFKNLLFFMYFLYTIYKG